MTPTLLSLSLRARIGVFSLVALNLFGVLAPAKSQTCSSHDQLVNINRQDLQGATPCDLTGAAFLWGWGAERTVYTERLSVDDRYQYYYLIRSHLGNTVKKSGVMRAEDVGLLLATMSMLPDLDGPAAQRAAYYRAFVLKEFLYAQKEDIERMKFALSDLIVFFLRDGPFDRFSELDCFIRSDIPTVPLKEVLASHLYKDCVKPR